MEGDSDGGDRDSNRGDRGVEVWGGSREEGTGMGTGTWMRTGMGTQGQAWGHGLAWGQTNRHGDLDGDTRAWIGTDTDWDSQGHQDMDGDRHGDTGT